MTPPFWSRSNPIDILGDASAERFRRALEVCFNSKNHDGVLVILAPQALTDPLSVAETLVATMKGRQYPLVACWMGGKIIGRAVKLLNEAGIPTYDTPERAREKKFYKPGNVKLKPKILKDGQDALEKAYGPEGRLFLVFHGGSGSSSDEIHEAVDYGVVKMNIDTDTQYAFTRPIVDHIFKNYDVVLKVDGEVGKKKAYDPRTYLTMAENSMAERVKQAVIDLRGVGTTLFSE